jgi:hypothetical protein
MSPAFAKSIALWVSASCSASSNASIASVALFPGAFGAARIVGFKRAAARLATSLMLDKGVGDTSGGDVAVFGDAKAIPELQRVRRTRRICQSQVLSYRQLRAITVCASLSFVADPRWREGSNSREDG